MTFYQEVVLVLLDNMEDWMPQFDTHEDNMVYLGENTMPTSTEEAIQMQQRCIAMTLNSLASKIVLNREP